MTQSDTPPDTTGSFRDATSRNGSSYDDSFSGTPLLGGWSMLASSAVVELLLRSGFDWVCLDAQHGQYDDGDVTEALAMTRHLETPVLVRVAANDAAVIGRTLDAGAAGVIVPMVNSAAEAERAVRACLYPPSGDRSRGPFEVHRGRDFPSVEEANASLQIGVMVETARALRNLEEIAAVPGVGFIFVGPLDLSIDLGTTIDGLLDGDGEVIADGERHPRPGGNQLERVVRVCRDNGIGSGIFTTNPDHLAAFRAMGFGRIAVATDVSLLQSAAGDLLAGQGRNRPAG